MATRKHTHVATVTERVGARLRGMGARARHLGARLTRRVGLSLALLVVILTGTLAQFAAAGLGLAPVAHAAAGRGTTGTPNRFNPRSAATSVSHPGWGQGTSAHAPAGPPQAISRGGPGPMRLGYLALQPGQAARFIGSDGQLEVDVPAGAVSTTDVTAAGGGISLRISQVAPAAGSNAGGSGLVSFGTYLIQVVDAERALRHQGLRQPVTLKLHYGKGASALDLSHAFVVFNGSLPATLTTDDVAPTTAPATGPQMPRLHAGQPTVPDAGDSPATPVTPAGIRLGTYHSQNTALDAGQKILTVTAALSDPSTSMTWNTDAPVATFGKPDPFSVDLNAGALSSSFPIDVPSGPGGLTPPVSLSYSSESVAEQHSPQGAAPWVGEGWNLSLGAISWAEHNSNATCGSGCGNGWEDTWQLSDPFGTASELIPPNINVSTYWDDTPDNYCGADGNANNSTSYPCPIQWHTAPETHAKVFAYVGSLSLQDGASAHPPCFRVFLPNGIMEEFGCTADSLEYYYTPNMGDYISSWNLDLITDPQGNQIHITYQQDVEQKNVSGVNHQYIRDAQLATIEWDSPGCHNAQSMCTGSSWAPLMRVNFAASHAPARLTNSPSGCNTGTNLRCDDPLDLSGSGGLVAPDVQTTYVLNDIQTQVRSSGTGSWNTLKDYQLSYQQTGPSTVTDPSTGKQESTAGQLLLTKLVTVGDDGSTALPTRTFSYSSHTSYYEDDLFHPNPSTNCGPTWNKGNGSGCLLWSQSYAGNSYYLSSASNGMGLQQTFSWDDARNNTHGVNGGGSNTANPLYCTDNSSLWGSYPCDEAYDQNWSHEVLTQQVEQVIRAASSGNVTVTSQTSYQYKLTYPLSAQECSDCVAGMYWGNQNDGDYLDYYNATFMGFTEADVTNPDGSVDVHKYDATEGYGLYDSSVPCLAFTPPCHAAPWWDLTNAAHGHEIETDTYDTNGTKLLAKTITQYQAICPPSGVSATPPWSTTVNGNPYTYTWDGNLVAELDHGNPVVACDVQTRETDSFTYDGASGTVPEKTTTYTYDGYGRTTSATTRTNDGNGLVQLEAESLPVVSNSAPIQVVNNCCNLIWSNNAELWLKSTATGQSVTLSFSVPTTGTYEVTGVMTQNHDNGISTLAIDGTQVGSAFDGYHAFPTIAPPFGYGTVSLSAGQHTATWTATGKNAASSNYYVSIDALELRLTSDSPTAIVTHTDYVWNDAVSASYSGATGTYLIDFPADVVTEDTANTTHDSCSFTSYDGKAFATGQTSNLTLGEATTADKYTSCGTSSNSFATSGLIRTTHTYDTYGNQITTDDPDANGGNGAHLGCTAGSTTYSTCDAYDTTFDTLPTSTTNALSQMTTTGYTSSAGGGFGLWPTSTTDFNGQTTTFGYDALGRMTSKTLPGETSGDTTLSWTYTFWCSATGAQAPCVEIDQTQRLNSSTTVTTRAFYDGYGNLVETRAPGPGGQDVVHYRDYDPSGRDVFDSISYFVPAYIGGPGAAAFATPDATQPGTAWAGTNWYGYDGLGRVVKVVDALSNTTTTSYSVVTGWDWNGSTSGDEEISVVDPLGHRHYTISDALGREIEDVRTTGTGTSGDPYVFYIGTKYGYDANGNLVLIDYPNTTAIKTTFTYDAVGRKTGMTDPDRGTESYTYDADGNLITSVDARGSAGTMYAGYDGIDRQLWRNTTNSPTGAFVQYFYDTNYDICHLPLCPTNYYVVGRLTKETFTGGPNNTLSGSYVYDYDLRGQQVKQIETVNGTPYTTQTTYDDAGKPTSQTYPDGEVVTTQYTAQDWLAGLTTQQGSNPATTLLNTVSYSGVGGAAQMVTGASLGNGTYTYAANYDDLLRLASVSYTRVSDGATLFGESRSFDATGNVVGLTTTLPEGTDVQAFCYDEQNRLTWASSASGAIPCGGNNTAGTLTAAQYQQSFSYDVDGRLTSGPLGSYTYGDSAHLHAVTSIGSTYTASYDAAGNMTCRAPTSNTTCAGTPTGAPLSYDAEGRLAAWQNAPGSSPSSSDAYLYDGEGNRVAQQSTQSGVTSTTIYVSNLEDISTTGGGNPTTTTYYYAGSLRFAEAVNGVVSYLATNALGSVSLAVDGSGNVQASTLYAPYGAVRYSSGTMPTDYGYTGQHRDALTGLDYYTARYYDPVAGQFASADSVLSGNGYDPWGLSRYAYVEGNPIGRTDPSGHCWLICAAIAAVVTTVAVTAVTAVAQYATTGTVDWGQAATTGVAAGLTVGAVMTLGPLAGAAIDAIGAGGGIAGAIGAVGDAVGTGLAGDAAIAASSSVADQVAVGVATGGIMGAGEGAAQGWSAGDRGGALAFDIFAGMASGAFGGAVGAGFAGPVASGVSANGAANLAGQAISHFTHGTGFNPVSFVIAVVTGGAVGAQTGTITGHFLSKAFAAAAADWATQYALSQGSRSVGPAAAPGSSYHSGGGRGAW